MNRTKRFAALLLYALVVSAIFTFAADIRDANSQPSCNVLIRKFAEPEDGTLFRFNFDEDGNSGLADLSSGSGFVISFSESASVEEELTPGWVIEDIQCIDIDGIVITTTPNGVEFDCEEGIVETNCTFFNVPGVFTTNIPTLSEWGMIAAAAGLGLAGVFFAVRRRRAFNS